MDWKRFFGFSWYKLLGFFFIAYFSYQSDVFDAVIRGFPFAYYTAEGFCPPGGCPPGEFSLVLLLLDAVLWYLALDLCFYFTLFKTSDSKVKNLFVHLANFFIGTLATILLLILLFVILPQYISRFYRVFINPREPGLALPIA